MTLAIQETESIFERVLRLCEQRAEQTFVWRRWHFDQPHSGRSPVEVGAFLQLNSGIQIEQISSEDRDNRFDADKCWDVKRYAAKVRRNPAYDYFNAAYEDGINIYKKQCYRCKQEYPATQSYFYTDTTKVSSLNPDGLMSRCKWCDNVMRGARDR